MTTPPPEIIRGIKKAITRDVARKALLGKSKVKARQLIEGNDEARRAYQAAKRLHIPMRELLSYLYPDLEAQHELFPGRPIRLHEVMGASVPGDFFRDVIIAAVPSDLIDSAYEGNTYGPIYPTRKIRDHPFGQRVMIAHSWADRGNIERKVNGILDRVYADREERFFAETGLHVTPSEALRGAVCDRKIREDLRDLFEGGADLGDRGLNHRHHRLWRRLRRYEPEEKLSGTDSIHMNKICTLIGGGVEPSHILPTEAGIKLIGNIGERAADLMLQAVVQYDQRLKRVTELGDLLEAPITHLAPRNNGNGARRLRNGTSFLEADGRLTTGEGDFAVEVKSGRTLNPGKFYDKLGKYDHARKWLDGTPVAGRLLVLNSGGDRVRNYGEALNSRTWNVLHAEEFVSAYTKGLELLAEHNPKVFGVFSPELLLQFNHEVSNNAHRLSIHGMNFMREWMDLALERVKILTDPTYHSPKDDHKDRKKFATIMNTMDPAAELVSRRNIKAHYRVPMAEFEGEYGEKARTVVVPNTIFLDWETAGLPGEGAPIVIGGLAYEQDGRMVIEQFVSRNPFEEYGVVKKVLEKMREYPRIVTFNGTTFDVPYARERAFVNRIIPGDAIPARHDDLYPVWREVAKRSHSTARLQTFEAGVLKVDREHDLDGAKFADAYAKYLLGINAGGLLYSGIRHNQLDLATLVLMDAHFGGTKRKM